MNALRILLSLALASFVMGVQAQRTFDATVGDTTYHMKQYWFVLYTRGADTTAMDSATSASLLKAHLEHQQAQSDRGLIIMAGPFGDNGDWRGMLLYDCETKEEVEGYLKRDPFVMRGRLKYEIHPWWGAMGTTLR